MRIHLLLFFSSHLYPCIPFFGRVSVHLSIVEINSLGLVSHSSGLFPQLFLYSAWLMRHPPSSYPRRAPVSTLLHSWLLSVRRCRMLMFCRLTGPTAQLLWPCGTPYDVTLCVCDDVRVSSEASPRIQDAARRFVANEIEENPSRRFRRKYTRDRVRAAEWCRTFFAEPTFEAVCEGGYIDMLSIAAIRFERKTRMAAGLPHVHATGEGLLQADLSPFIDLRASLRAGAKIRRRI
ncbi:hypothetical protein K474DRAFT_1129612 [Panus rudis PR-1116 ss-1]|nr:hypothetical protein K474DRAFT_1129612 [Panus rudis PR-1116 ss-1]